VSDREESLDSIPVSPSSELPKPFTLSSFIPISSSSAPPKVELRLKSEVLVGSMEELVGVVDRVEVEVAVGVSTEAAAEILVDLGREGIVRW